MVSSLIKILVVDDHKLIREGMIYRLSRNPAFEIVGEAVDGKEAIKKSIELSPDIILMDIRMPVMDGLEAAVEIQNINPDAEIIIISALKDEEYISEALKAGAKGYILKDSFSEDIDTAIDTVIHGGIFLDKNVSRLLLNDYIRKLRQTDSPDNSKKRKRKIDFPKTNEMNLF
jgi:DNA-binding NarL/FixJ family response regulator